MGHFPSPAISHPCAPLLKFLFFLILGNPEGLISTKLLFSLLPSFFGMSFFVFFPSPLFLSLGPFRPMLAHHAPANRNLKNFDLDMFTLRQIKLHRMVNRSAFDLGAFYCTQNFLEASQDGSSPSLFVREAIL